MFEVVTLAMKQRQQEEDPDAGEQRQAEHQRDRALAELDALVALLAAAGRLRPTRSGRASACRRTGSRTGRSSPRRNGSLAQREPWKPESRRSVA